MPRKFSWQPKVTKTQLRRRLMETPKVIEGVIADAKAVESAVETAVAEGKAEVSRIEISVEEKLNIRNIENDFLKQTMEIKRLQASTAQLQKQFPAYIDSLVKKYSVDTKLFNFDAVTLGFNKL